MSKQQKYPGQSLFAGVKQLINQIFFVADVARQQICHEQVGKLVFPVKRFHHRFLVNSQNRALYHGNRRSHAQRLAGKAAFTAKIAAT